MSRKYMRGHARQPEADEEKAFAASTTKNSASLARGSTSLQRKRPPVKVAVAFFDFLSGLLAVARDGIAFEERARNLKTETKNGKTDNSGTLRRADGSHYSCRGFHVLQKPVLATADRERRNCRGVRGFLLEIPETSMKDVASVDNRAGCEQSWRM
jgi:hypothetical protein